MASGLGGRHEQREQGDRGRAGPLRRAVPTPLPQRTTPSLRQCGQRPPAASPLPTCPGPTSRQPTPRPASHSKPTSSPSLAQVPTLITIWHPHPSQHLPPEANPSQSTQAQPQKTRKRVPPCPAPCCRLALRPLAGGRGCRGAGVQAQSHWGEWGGEVLRVSVSGFTHLSHVGDKS